MAAGRTIARNSALLGVAFGVSKVFGVALTAIAGRVLGPAVFGLYVTGVTLVEIGRILGAAGLDYLVAREVASDPQRATSVATNAAVVKVGTGIVVWALLLGLVGLLDYPVQVLWVVVILGSALFFENLSDILDAVLQGVQRVRATTVAFALAGAATFGTGALALYGGLGLKGYATCFVVGFLVRFGWTSIAVRRMGVATLSAAAVDRVEIRRLVVAGLPLLSATILALVFHRMDLLMLSKMSTAEEVGLYAAAVRIIDVIVLLPRILATAVYPALRQQTDAGVQATLELLADSLRVSLTLCTLAGLGVWVFARLALVWIPGPEFEGATTALRLLSWGVVLQGGAHLGARLLLAIDAERYFTLVAALSLACNFVLNLLWIPRYGIEGAALATLVSYAVNFALYLYFASRRGYRLSLRRSVVGPVGAVVAAAAVSMALESRALPVTGLAMGGAWIVALVALRGVRGEDLHRARKILLDRG